MNSPSGPPAIFTHPPLDGTLTLDQIYDWNRVKSQEIAAFVFPTDESEQPEGTRDRLTWKEVGEGIIRGTELAERYIPEIRGGSHRNTLQGKEDPLAVGILATSDMVTYSTFLLSLIRLTHPTSPGRALLPFPISTRNSSADVARLVQLAGVRYLWITEDHMRTIVNEALKHGGLRNTIILQIPSFSDLYPITPPASSPRSAEYDDEETSLDMPALILHSSGSTAFPKVRTLTHGMLLEWSRLFEHGELRVEGETLNVHGLAPFNAGGIFTVSWAAASGITRAVPFPGVALPPATPENVLELIVKTKSTLFFCVPTFLEAWSKNPSSFETLSKLKALFWGGGHIQGDAGRFLHKQGIRIQMLFGSTETGVICLVPKAPYPEGYEWFKFSPHVMYELKPEPQEEGAFELVFKQCDTHHMPCLNAEMNGIPAYETSDLIERHPTKPDMFKIRGRTDDQIMLSTGEKTNPIPLESMIARNLHVKNAIMFGRGQLFNGILIEPISFEEAEKLGIEKFRNLIWSDVREANNCAPAHSRIFKEMILLASASKPFTYAGKGTPRRASILTDYAPEINAIYMAVQESLQIEGPLPPFSNGWNFEQSLDIVRKVIKKVMTAAEGVGDDDYLFGLGCDGLQATYIRNSLLYALRQNASPSKTQSIPSDFVYQQSTIRSLAMSMARISRPKVASGA